MNEKCFICSYGSRSDSRRALPPAGRLLPAADDGQAEDPGGSGTLPGTHQTRSSGQRRLQVERPYGHRHILLILERSKKLMRF